MIAVYPHWGIEKFRYPEPADRNLAHRIIDAGADIIVGHHPHIIQPIEIYKGKYIIYSIGNFILPQTVYYTSDELGEKEYRITNEILKRHSNLHIFVRERKSYNFIKQKFEFTGNSNIYLVPDMVLYGKNIITREKCTGYEKVINVCIREDCESEQENY